MVTKTLTDTVRVSTAYDLLREIADRARAGNSQPTTAAPSGADTPKSDTPEPTEPAQKAKARRVRSS